MQPIQQNPFHILGITADASQRTIARRKAKINAFQKVEKEIVFDDDLILGNKPDRSAESINKALTEVDKNESKVRHALFWFVNYNHLDNTALEYLKDGDFAKAQEIWQKVTSGKPVSAKNFSAHNNQGTLNLYLSAQSSFTDKELLQNGVALKTELILSDFFEQFVNLIADETYTIDAEQTLEAYTGTLLTEFKNFDYEKVLNATLSEAHPELEQVVAQKITQGPLNDLEWKIKETKQHRTKHPEKGLNLGANLYEKNIDNLEVLNNHLGQENLQYKSLRDKLANEILQCGIKYFKEYEEDEELHEEKVQKNGQFREFNFDGDLGNDIMQLFKKADAVAVGEQVKDRVAENLKGVQAWVENNVRIKLLPEKWKDILNDLKSISPKLEDKEASPKDALKLINSFSIDELNRLGEFADQFRVSMALILRGISVSIWNNHHDIDRAIKVILKALKIELDPETKDKLNSDYSQLKKLKKELDEQGKPINSAPSLHTVNGIGTTIYGKTLYIVFFAIPIIPIARYNCEPTINGYRFFGKVKLQPWQKVWQYGVLLAVAYFVIKMIIQSN
jgi:flagellin-specific chaperone FliS